jgi:pimeloyl-ACP methyl ester carboxylesterase
VGQFLVTLDGKLTPQQGMRQVRPGAGGGYALHRLDRKTFEPSGRVLVIVHGTFSNTDHILAEFQSTNEGRAFLGAALGRYDSVLLFDHPTLSVGAVLNALDLSRWFARAKPNTKVDVVCHSRGGLVTRWWAEVMGGARLVNRAVLVGSPLAGTSLAAPPKLRAVAVMLTNWGNVLEAAGAAATLVVPLFSIATGILKVITSVTSVVGKTPLFDAAVAMIPGLACQSRVGNNPEIMRLRDASAFPAYYAVVSNFEAAPAGWKFWRHFFDRSRLADRAADCLFDAENDLVVDTSSMCDLGEGDAAKIREALTFGPGDGVHHLNYFSHPKTIAFLAEKLAVPL